MNIHDYQMVDWKQVLSDDAYQALRLGHLEQPHTGKYVHTTDVGVYRCAGCGTPLFSSETKIDDGSGYATFTAPIQSQTLSILATYTEAGEPVPVCVCAVCGGKIGRLDSQILRSSTDLEEGTSQQYYHISSRAVVFKKALTPRNYPIGTFILVGILCIVGYMGWAWFSNLASIASRQHIDSSVPLWVGDMSIEAVVVRLDGSQASTTGTLIRQDEALLFVLGDHTGIPAVRFANHSIDVLWLDASFKVVGWEQQRASQTSQALDRPPSAQYGIIAQSGILPAQAFSTGFEVIVTDRTRLL